MDMVLSKTRMVYEYLKEKKAFRKIVIALVIINILPFKQAQFITFAVLLLWGFAFIVSLMPDMPPHTPIAAAQPDHNEQTDDEWRKGYITLTQTLITDLLEEELGETEWSWGTEYTPWEYALYLHNGSYVRVFLKDSEYDAADIAFHPMYTVELIDFTAVWFEKYGKDAVSELVYAANSQGVRKLVLSNALIPDLPDQSKWESLVDILDNEGYKTEILESGIQLTWPRKRVIKMSEKEAA